jgi:hypothetical protein
VPGGLLHLQDPFRGQVTKAIRAIYMNSEDLTRDLVVPCFAGAADPQLPPNGGSANIMNRI